MNNENKTTFSRQRMLIVLVSLAIVICFSSCSTYENDNNSTSSDQLLTKNHVCTPECFETDLRYMGSTSSYDQHTTVSFANQPLFGKCGNPNPEVAKLLLEWIDEVELVDNGVYKESTNKEFSNHITKQLPDGVMSADIVLPLIPVMLEKTGIDNGHVSEFSANWWTIVYRSVHEDNDVITLWMKQPYRTSIFNGDKYPLVNDYPQEIEAKLSEDTTQLEWWYMEESANNAFASDEDLSAKRSPSQDYTKSHDYSRSIVRNNLLRDFDFVLKSSNISEYIVTPQDLPGNWQSSDLQTGKNIYESYFDDFRDTSISGLGAVGLTWGTDQDAPESYSVLNGMDGLSLTATRDDKKQLNMMDDPVWIPSDYEVNTRGYGIDKIGNYSYLPDSLFAGDSLLTDTFGGDLNYDDYRSGLWNMNGFDRTFDKDNSNNGNLFSSRINWLRSAPSYSIGSSNVVSNTSVTSPYSVTETAGIRPAIHISVTKLREFVNSVQ